MNDMTEQEEQPLLLLVDDDPTFTRVMARALSRRGLRVNTAGDADEAMQLARQEQPDYAVLDLKMEGDSGLVLLPRLLELMCSPRCCPSRPTRTPWCLITRCRWIGCSGSIFNVCWPSMKAISRPLRGHLACIGAPCNANCRSARSGADRRCCLTV